MNVAARAENNNSSRVRDNGVFVCKRVMKLRRDNILETWNGMTFDVFIGFKVVPVVVFRNSSIS